MESLIRTPSIEEAVAFLESFVHGEAPRRLWIVGGPGVGKTFLARWAKNQAANGRRGAILDEGTPDPTWPAWIALVPDVPADPMDGDFVYIGPPEYERKIGVLEEWAATRGLRWDRHALERLATIDTDNLQTLRSLAERTAREAVRPAPEIREVDVLRTFARLGLLTT